MNNSIVLQASNLVKTYRDGESQVEVLKGIDLTIAKGEMAAIFGSSGSGKSTLLHLLGALDSVDSGRVLICGEDIFSLPIKKQGALRNRYLGFVYQFHHLLQEFTAIENVAIPLLIAGKEPAQAMEAAADMVAKVGLKNRGSHRPSALSGGERQRIAIARALVTRPACILADEPTGNLDRKNAESVYELMSELNSMEQTAFLIVSHDSQLARYMDRHYILADGVLQVNEK